MTTPPTPQPQPAPLPERIAEALRLTPQGAAAPWVVDYCGGGEYLISSDTGPIGRFGAASGEGDSDEAYLIAAAPTLRALLAETAAALAAAQEREAVLREALAFYADTENYRGTGVPYLLISTGEVEDDWGTIARDALGGQS